MLRWTRVFHIRPHLNDETRFLFICKKLIFRKRLGVVTYFSFFLKRKPNKKENLYDSLFGKDMFAKTEFGFGGQVTYWEGTVLSHNIPLSPYTYHFY